MTNKELIDRFYNEGLSTFDWEVYDRVDDYCVECSCEWETEDGYTYSADASYSCDEYELISLSVKTPEGEEISLI